MQHQNSQMERWSVGAWSALLIDNRWEANWQSLGSGSAIAESGGQILF